jgi:hypothetical protein
MVAVLYGSTALLAYVLSIAAAHLLLAAGRMGQGAPCAAQVPCTPVVSPSSSPMKSALLPPAPERDVERSFLVESPYGELMQVELLLPVVVAGW